MPSFGDSFSGLWPHHLKTVFLVSGHITWGQFFWSLTSAYPRDRLCLRPRLTGSIPPDFSDILHKQFPAFIGSYRNSSICIVLETIQYISYSEIKNLKKQKYFKDLPVPYKELNFLCVLIVGSRKF